jgi:SWI/SNF related-matrix-associated actin-dependent regulator of chromatin subfamily C
VCKILAAAAKFKHEKSLRRFDFHSPKSAERNLEMFSFIEQELMAQAVLYVRAIYLMPTVSDEDRQLATDYVEKLQGYIADSAEEATHVIHPNPPVQTNATQLRAIPVLKRGKGKNNVLLHWKYHPLSHDSWISCASPQVNAYIIDYKPSVFHVSLSWLTESFKWNEWMHEEDFEVGEQGQNKHDRYLTTQQINNLIEAGKPKKRVKGEDEDSQMSQPTSAKKL